MHWFLLGFVIALFLYQSLKSGVNAAAGLKGFHLIGSPEKGLHLHQQLTKWVERYGDVFLFRMGLSTVLVLSSPKAINETLNKKGNIYSSRPVPSSQADLVAGRGRMISMVYGEKFRERRRLVHSLLSIQNSKIFQPYQEYESRQTLKNLLDAPEHFYNEMHRYSASVTFGLLLGARFDRSDALLPRAVGEEMAKLFMNMRSGAWLADWLPFLDYLPDRLAPWRKRACGIYSEILEFYRVFVDNIELRVKRGTAPDCFLSRLIETPASADLSVNEKAHLIEELLAAGSETTGTSLQWFLKAILKFPDWAEEARRELDRVVGSDRLPEWSDRVNLPYMSAAIEEMHRLASVAPLAFYHATSEADTLRGKTIKKATTVIPNVYAVHHSDQYFPEHSKFLPGRWLPIDDPRHVPNAAFTPTHLAFGTGRRECPGKHVADGSIFILISRVLWGFNLLPGEYPPSDETRGSLPVLGPAPFVCKVVPRSKKHADKIRALAAVLDPGLTVEDGSVYDEEVKKVLQKWK